MHGTRAAANLIGCLAGIACLAGAHAARADHRPVIAIPGNPQVPVVIDGRPASGAMVNGDWGLYAPGRVAPEIIGPVVIPLQPEPRGYFPHGGQRPRYGRQEVVTPRQQLPQAPSYYREWSAESGSGPVTEYPPYDPPAITIDPTIEPRSRVRRRR